MGRTEIQFVVSNLQVEKLCAILFEIDTICYLELGYRRPGLGSLCSRYRHILYFIIKGIKIPPLMCM